MKTLYSIYIHLLSVSLAFVLYLLQWKRKTIQHNLYSYSLKRTEAKRVSRETFLFLFYRNLSQDIFLFLHGHPSEPLWISPTDQLKLHSFINSGGCLLTAHYHNWELLGSYLRKKGLKLLGIAAPLKSTFWNRRLLLWRKRINLPTISKKIPYTAKNWIQNKKVFGILLDQHKHQGTPSSFFKQPIFCSKLPKFLLQTSNCSFYAVFLQSNNRVRIIHLYNPKHSRSNTFSSLKIYQRYHKSLEVIIQNNPSLYYGLAHKRIKQKNGHHSYP